MIKTDPAPRPKNRTRRVVLISADEMLPDPLPAGLLIRRLRELCGITQIELAERAGANLSYISSIENHPSNLSLRMAMQIMRAMEIDPVVLMQVLDNVCKIDQLRRTEQDRAKVKVTNDRERTRQRPRIEVKQSLLPTDRLKKQTHAGLKIADAPTPLPEQPVTDEVGTTAPAVNTKPVRRSLGSGSNQDRDKTVRKRSQ